MRRVLLFIVAGLLIGTAILGIVWTVPHVTPMPDGSMAAYYFFIFQLIGGIILLGRN
nr:hypothetical protein 66 [Balneolaceae bacterium]